MTEPASPAWYANERAIGHYWVNDPIFPDPSTDVGLSVQAALTAILNAGGGGSILIPALPNGAHWTWKTSIVQNTTEFGLHIELCGMPGTIIDVALSNTSSYVFYLININNGLVAARNLVFLGPATGIGDTAGVLLLASGHTLIERCQFYGISTNQAFTGMVGGNNLHMRDCKIVGCGHVGATGGTVFLAGGAAIIENVLFQDIGSFDGRSFGAIEGATGAWIYSENASHIEIQECDFDEAQNAAIWIDLLSSSPDATVAVTSCAFNTANPAVGTTPASIKVTRQGLGQLSVLDSVFNESANRTAFDLANVGQFNLERCQGLYQGQITTQQAINGVCRSGNGHFYLSNNYASVLIDTSVAAPISMLDVGLGLSALRPIGTTAAIPGGFAGCAAAYLSNVGTFLSPLATDLGSAAPPYTAVTANHHLDMLLDGTVPSTIVFTGTENSQATFFTTINGSGSLCSASNSAGKTLLSVLELNGVCSGSILGSSSADVLTTLGLSVGAFTSPAIVAQLTDESGLNDATHNLGGAGATQQAPDTSFNGQPTLAFRAAQSLTSPAWSSALAQPFAIMLVGRQRVGATAYVSDGATADQCSISGNAANNAVTLNAGVAATFPVSDTTKAHAYVFVVNGSNSQLYLDCETPMPAQNAGANSLTALTLGNQGGGASLAGWDIAGWFVRPLLSGVPTHQLAKSFLEYASKQWGIPLLAPVTAIGAIPWITQTTGTYTLSLSQFTNGEANIAADTSAGTITDTLPTAPPDGTLVRFADVKQKWNVNALTVNSGGSDKVLDPNNITAAPGTSDSLTIKGSSVTLKYVSSVTTWFVI